MPLSDDLRAAAADVWEAQHRHPFVTGIGSGTLPRDVFAFWVRQDYRFLVEYGRALALTAARAPDLEAMRRFAGLAHETLGTEMDLHRSFCADLGIAPADLEAEPMAPTTRAYTDFLVRVAGQGDFAEAAAALLPCMWGFSEVGRGLAAGPRPDDPHLAAWIDLYASDAFAELAGWCRDVVDRAGEDAGPRTRAAMERAFVASSRYELAFWQMAFDERPGARAHPRNPLPVAVAVVPVAGGGLLAVRRAIPPEGLALPGGYVEWGESWQEAAARELEEETGVRADPGAIRELRVLSAPDGTLLVFGAVPEIAPEALGAFVPSREVSALEVLRAPSDAVVFPLHARVVAEVLAGATAPGG